MVNSIKKSEPACALTRMRILNSIHKDSNPKTYLLNFKKKTNSKIYNPQSNSTADAAGTGIVALMYAANGV